MAPTIKWLFPSAASNDDPRQLPPASPPLPEEEASLPTAVDPSGFAPPDPEAEPDASPDPEPDRDPDPEPEPTPEPDPDPDATPPELPDPLLEAPLGPPSLELAEWSLDPQLGTKAMRIRATEVAHRPYRDRRSMLQPSAGQREIAGSMRAFRRIGYAHTCDVDLRRTMRLVTSARGDAR